MATVKTTWGTKTSLTVTGLSTLASATYVASASYNTSTNGCLDLVVELSVATTNTPAGNKQVVIFAQASYDGGSTWQSGPTSGTTTTDEPNLTFIGTIPINSSSTTETKAYPIAPSYGGVLPPMVRLVIKNDLGVALTSGSASTVEIGATVA